VRRRWPVEFNREAPWVRISTASAWYRISTAAQLTRYGNGASSGLLDWWFLCHPRDSLGLAEGHADE
jgi:hypothetical protein